METEYAEVGKRIAKLRKTYGYTQEKLAELADISIQFVVDIERGKKTMKIGTLRKICSALNVSADYIINGTEPYTGAEEMNSLLSRLSAEERAYAIKLVSVFVEALG